MPAGGQRQTCVRCVMDTSDAAISFDREGVCNHCHAYGAAVATGLHRGDEGRGRLQALVDRIKREGAGQRYDCVIGVSGGVDSTYTALLVKKAGLRPLAVHLDNGWNSEVSVRNIEGIVNRLGIDLYTEVLDWEEFRRLQLAFLRASTPDSEIPTDHAIFATLFRVARRERIRWLIDGGNLATELMVPAGWSHGHADWKYIRELNRLLGAGALKTYPRFTLFDQRVRIPWIDRLQRLSWLNYVDYDKASAMKAIRDELGWEYYGGKHYESIYTRFYQGYILKEKFGFDKRKSHLSCLVNAGGLTREEALRELDKPAIEPAQLQEDRLFVIKKLRVSEREFDEIMAAPAKTFWDYPSYEKDLASGSPWRAAYWVVRLARVLDFCASVGRGASLLARSPAQFRARVAEKLQRRGTSP